jgi:hypothetical protein
MKKLHTILLTLFLFSSVYADEQKTTYYPTGEVEESVDGNVSRYTYTYPTGEVWYVKKVLENMNQIMVKQYRYG